MKLLLYFMHNSPPPRPFPHCHYFTAPFFHIDNTRAEDCIFPAAHPMSTATQSSHSNPVHIRAHRVRLFCHTLRMRHLSLACSARDHRHAHAHLSTLVVWYLCTIVWVESVDRHVEGWGGTGVWRVRGLRALGGGG